MENQTNIIFFCCWDAECELKYTKNEKRDERDPKEQLIILIDEIKTRSNRERESKQTNIFSNCESGKKMKKSKSRIQKNKLKSQCYHR